MTNDTTRQMQSRSSKLLTGAVLCAWIPTFLALGLWYMARATRSDSMILGGFVAMFVVVLLTFVGGACLVIRHRMMEEHNLELTPSKTTLVGVHLFANYPLCAFVGYKALLAITSVVIQVHNQSGQEVTTFLLNGPGVTEREAPLEPGEHVEWEFRVHGDGQLTFEGLWSEAGPNQGTFTGIALDYVTTNLQGAATIQLNPGGDVSVTQP